MLTPGNKKLGRHLIWAFALPSGDPGVCVGMSPTCRRECYAIRTEIYRRAAARRYRLNLALSRRRDFARRVRAFLTAHAIRVVRVHTGGDFYSAKYAGKWLTVMRRSRRTKFFFYSRSWRRPEIRAVLERMAHLRNCRVWWSADCDTGLPENIPPRVRIAWLLTRADEIPPPGVHLVFRVRRLRNQPATMLGAGICPAEDGVPRPHEVTCDRCQRCWRPLPSGRVPLPVIDPTPHHPNSTETR